MPVCISSSGDEKRGGYSGALIHYGGMSGCRNEFQLQTAKTVARIIQEICIFRGRLRPLQRLAGRPDFEYPCIRRIIVSDRKSVV